jgi:four helix bundle protein
MLINKLTDSDAEATETQIWLDFAQDCGYLSRRDHDRLTEGYGEGRQDVVWNDLQS